MCLSVAKVENWCHSTVLIHVHTPVPRPWCIPFPEISELCAGFSTKQGLPPFHTVMVYKIFPAKLYEQWVPHQLSGTLVPSLHSYCSWASQQKGINSLHCFKAITLTPALQFWNNNLYIPRKSLDLQFTVNSWAFLVPRMLERMGKYCLLLESLKTREGGRVLWFSWSGAAP